MQKHEFQLANLVDINYRQQKKNPTGNQDVACQIKMFVMIKEIKDKVENLSQEMKIIENNQMDIL